MTDTPNPVSEERLAEIRAQAREGGWHAFRSFRDDELPALLALLDERAAEIAELRKTVLAAQGQADDLYHRFLAAEAREAVLRAALERLCDYANAEYVPNILFERARAALASSPTQEDADVR